MRSLLALACIAALGAACAAGASTQQADRASFTPRPVASGFEQPIFVTGAKGEPGRLYVVEQGGRILVLQNGRRRATPLLDIRSRVTADGEQGLLGLAFHPSYPKVRKLYVQYTARNGSTKVVEYRTNGNRASAPRQLFSSPDPYGNHNGGMLAFGPNGRLYFTMGDGGAGGDPENRAQNMRSLFGKLLSINVATKGLKIEALGLRNAWRFSFDRANGDLYIGDVGQGDVRGDRLPAGREPRPRELRLGRLRGPLARSRTSRSAPGKLVHAGRPVQPQRTAARSRAATSTAARTPRCAAATSTATTAAGSSGASSISGGKATGLRRERFRIESVTSFGQDNAGELYGVSHGGTIYRLTP